MVEREGREIVEEGGGRGKGDGRRRVVEIGEMEGDGRAW